MTFNVVIEHAAIIWNLSGWNSVIVEKFASGSVQQMGCVPPSTSYPFSVKGTPPTPNQGNTAVQASANVAIWLAFILLYCPLTGPAYCRLRYDCPQCSVAPAMSNKNPKPTLSTVNIMLCTVISCRLSSLYVVGCCYSVRPESSNKEDRWWRDEIGVPWDWLQGSLISGTFMYLYRSYRSGPVGCKKLCGKD